MSLVAGNLLRWQYITLLILEHTEGTGDKLFVPYEGLMREPCQQAQRLYTFLNQSCQVKGGDRTRISQMAQAVDPGLWHSRSQRSFSKVHEATSEQRALYQFLKRTVVSPLAAFEREQYPMPPGWREVIKHDEALVRAHSRSQGPHTH